MLYYRSYTACGGKRTYEAFTKDHCTGVESPVSLSSPTIQAVVAYGKKHGLSLKRVD